MQRSFSLIAWIWLFLLSPVLSGAQTVSILPNAMNQFIDANGAPYASGRVYFYSPGTTTPKNTWQDAGGTTLNTNPILLDAAGRAIIYGIGSYREVLQDSLGNVVWDQLTQGLNPLSFSTAGTAGGTANALTLSSSTFTLTDGQTIEFTAPATNTGPATLEVIPNASTPLSITKMTLTGPAVLSGGEIVAGTQYLATYSSSANTFQLVSFPLFSSFPSGTTQGSLVTKGSGNYSVSPVFDIAANGAVGDGSTDNSIVFQNVLNLAGISGGRVHLPCGTYKFLTTQALSVPADANVDFDGSGAGCTTLYFSGPISGLTVTYQGLFSTFSARHLTFATDQNGGPLVGLTLQTIGSSTSEYGGGNSTIEDVTFEGWNHSSTATNYWNTAFLSIGVSNLNFIGGFCQGPNSPAGTCYNIAGTGTGINPFAVVMNFWGTAMNLCNIGIYYGEWIQGITLSDSNITGCNYGVTTGPGNESGDLLDQLTVNNGQMNIFVCGICINAVTFNDLLVDTELFIVESGATGISVQGTGWQINNSQFGAAGYGTGVGIAIYPSYAMGGTVSNTTIADFLYAIAVPSSGSTQAFVTGLKYTIPTTPSGAREYSIGSAAGIIFDEIVPQNFSTLPACTTGIAYSRAVVADSTTGTYGATITGGGTYDVNAMCSGAFWQVR